MCESTLIKLVCLSNFLGPSRLYVVKRVDDNFNLVVMCDTFFFLCTQTCGVWQFWSPAQRAPFLIYQLVAKLLELYLKQWKLRISLRSTSRFSTSCLLTLHLMLECWNDALHSSADRSLRHELAARRAWAQTIPGLHFPRSASLTVPNLVGFDTLTFNKPHRLTKNNDQNLRNKKHSSGIGIYALARWQSPRRWYAHYCGEQMPAGSFFFLERSKQTNRMFDV